MGTVSDANVNLDDEEGLVRTIISQLRPVVLAEVRSAIAASNANYNAEELANKIVVRLIPFVREGVRVEVKKVVVKPVPVAPVAPAGGSSITNIFGTGGANSVQVEIPNYNYEYNHARSLE